MNANVVYLTGTSNKLHRYIWVGPSRGRGHHPQTVSDICDDKKVRRICRAVVLRIVSSCMVLVFLLDTVADSVQFRIHILLREQRLYMFLAKANANSLCWLTTTIHHSVYSNVWMNIWESGIRWIIIRSLTVKNRAANLLHIIQDDSIHKYYRIFWKVNVSKKKNGMEWIY